MTHPAQRRIAKIISIPDLTPEQVAYIAREFPSIVTPPESRASGIPQYLNRRNELVFDEEMNLYKGVPQFLYPTWPAYKTPAWTTEQQIAATNKYIMEKYGQGSQYSEWFDSTREPHSITPADVEQSIRAVQRADDAFEGYAAGYPAGITEGGDARADADRGDVGGTGPGDGRPDGDPEGTAPEES